MDEAERRYWVALMGRVNDNHEAVFIYLRNLRTTVDTTQEFVTQSPSLIVQALQAALLERLTAIEDRLRKLEGGAP